MQILVNTDKSIQNDARLTEYAQGLTQSHLEHFTSLITRVKIHLSDENAGKGGADDKKCTIETRIEHLKPIAVSHNSANVEGALTGALEKTHQVLKKIKGKNFDVKNKQTASKETPLP